MIADEETNKGNVRRNDVAGAKACAQVNSHVGLLHQDLDSF
jgi:hypothetical protein